MSSHPSRIALEHWQALVQAYQSSDAHAISVAQQAFLELGEACLPVIQQILHQQRNLYALVAILPALTVGVRQAIFPQLVELASCLHGGATSVRAAITSLPRAWVLMEIERVAEPLLLSGEEDRFRRLLELYQELDPALTQRLAKRAQHRPDAWVQEAGLDLACALFTDDFLAERDQPPVQNRENAFE